MSGGGGGGDKTEKPTAKRLREARRKGQLGRTPDLGAWAGLAAGVLLVPAAITATRDRVTPLLTGIADVARHPEPAVVLQSLATGASGLVPVLAPVLGVTVAVAIGAAAAQGGLHLATDNLKPQLKRLNPATGLKNMVSPVQAWQLAKSLLKTVVIGAVLWVSISALLPVLVGASALPLSTTVAITGGGAASLIRYAVIAGLVLAAVDFAVVRAKHVKDLRMSKQEVKDEMKSSEGNPQVKAAIRAKQRAMGRNRMMAAIATADVVLVNPTHVAVALRYDASRGAPRVVAKGSGHVAARIRERATEAGVPLVADVPLARALHAACKLDQEVPAHLYVAVAQVLAFVMALRKRGSAAGVHRVPVAA